MKSQVKAICLLLTLVGCGDSLVGTEYRGEPLFSFEGIILTFLDEIPDEETTRVALGWSESSDVSFDLDYLKIENSASTSVRFPSIFEVNIFYPPQRSLFEELDSKWALAYILIYSDENQNQTLDEGELIGGAPEQGLLYSEQELSAEESPTGQRLPAGFHIIPLPLSCEPKPVVEGQDCNVPLGAACETNVDCGTGTCLREVDGLYFPEGYCALLEDNPEACVPEGGLVIDLGIDDQDIGWWGKACQSDPDCRVDQGYACNLAIGVCAPKLPFWLVVDWDLEFESLCE
jgi:hypothetical protein